MVTAWTGGKTTHMEILDMLGDSCVWEGFFTYKEASRHTTKKELKALRDFIENEGYKEIASRINEETLCFALPKKSYINKKGSSKKRVVYIFPYAEKTVLQLICFLLEKYDNRFCNNCYAFRMNRSVKDAALDIRKIPHLKYKYAAKLDIHDYFNSIPTERLIERLKHFVDDDPKLLEFLIKLYYRAEVLSSGRIIKENHGAMAGSPLSGFMANLYLTDMDFEFYKRGLPYFRYSDDIIIFADTEKERDEALTEIKAYLENAGLEINPDKNMLTAPGEEWDYLGFSYRNGEYDLSAGTILKTKRKIKRYAGYLYRKKIEKNRTYEETAALFLKRFNKIFFDESEENEFCWKRWYFSIITTADGLHIIDNYMQEYLRYLYSGRHYKGNFKITYDKLKAMGYRNLVAEYYDARAERLSRKSVHI